jgi:O-antigen/teichoic acid export membrane protein
LGQQRSYARLVLGVFLLELVLEVALIPVWGYYGACTGSIAGELVFTITGLALCRYLGIGRIDWKSLLGAAVAAAAMATVLWPARTASLPIALAAVFLSGLVYGLLCFLFGALRRHELGQLTRVLVGLFPRKFSPGSGLGDGRRSPVQLERKGNPHGGSQGP